MVLPSGQFVKLNMCCLVVTVSSVTSVA